MSKSVLVIDTPESCFGCNSCIDAVTGEVK